MKISKNIKVLTEEDERYLLETLNDTKSEYPQDSTIIDLFNSQVLRSPEKVAVICGDRRLTYSELNAVSNQLSHYLIENYSISPDDLIGIELDRSEWMVIGILGILKSGGAYVPINPDYPSERKAFIYEDAGLKAVLTESELERFNQKKATFPTTSPDTGLRADNLIYVIYTSGSTGVPKGCMLEHRGIVNRLTWMQKSYELTERDSILQKTTFTFDVSVWELIWWSLQGASVVMLEPGGEKQPEKIISAVAFSQVTVMHFVPSMLGVFLEYLTHSKDDLNRLSSLRQVYTSGEALQVEHVRRFKELLPEVKLMNLYGPTEASIDVSYYSCDQSNENNIPIGRPIDNILLYVLESATQRLVPYGSVGEICIGGVGLARGYLNRLDLTREKFIDNPYRKGEKLYRTGDLGRWREDGNLEYVGRMDDQVKIRGYSIELGEIEHVLSGYPASGQAIVIARFLNAMPDKELIAYTTGEASAEDLRAYLKERLPHYMVPTYYVKLDKIPLTGSGKADRKSLPNPQSTGLATGAYVPPGTETEKQLVQIWSEVLGVQESTISITTDFFALGGNSLKAILLLGRVHKQLGVKLDLKQLFFSPTVEQLAKTADTRSVQEEYTSLAKILEVDDYSLSSSQKRLWVLSRFEGANVAYNMPFIVRLNGPLNEEIFNDSYLKLISRHESLRTVFLEDEQGNPRQRMLSVNNTRFFLQIKDFSQLQTERKEEIINSYITQELNREFNLEEGPLIRCGLLKDTEINYILILVMHHIVSDGWSMGVFQEELSEFYNAALEERNPNLAPLIIQYKDYAAWHNARLESNSISPHKQFWLEKFKHNIPILELPSDKTRPKPMNYKGLFVRRELDINSTERLRRFSQVNGGTMFMTLQSALFVLLNKYTGQNDIVIGSPTAGRDHPDLINQIGFFLGALPIRVLINKAETFEALYQKIKETDADVLTHQLYPYDQLTEDLDFIRDSGRNPLFDVWLDYHSSEINSDKLFLNGIVQSEYLLHERDVFTKFDLTFVFHEKDNQLILNFEYNTQIYTSHQITKLLDNLIHILTNLPSFSGVRISDIDIIHQQEKNLILESHAKLNPNNIIASDHSLSKNFEEVALRNVHKTAIKCASNVYTYAQLNALANQFAVFLKSNYELKEEDIVALKLPRDEWMIIAMLGVMKARCCYLPIDYKYPERRIDYIINDSNCVAVIDSEQLDHFKIQRFAYSKENLSDKPQSNQLAYCIYTSGSTGMPKGVLVEHGQILNTIHSQIDHFCIDWLDHTLSLASFAFDASVSEIFTTLLSGAVLHLISDNSVNDAQFVSDYILHNSISYLTVTPAYLRNMNLDSLACLKKLISAGDFADYRILKELKRRGISVINAYGPTETSICATVFNLENLSKYHHTVPIGIPIAGASIVLLDENLQLVPYGSIGEICVGGAGLARGYLNREELTNERFISSPFSTEQRLYRTGDLGRWREDGNLDYFGRIDNQVKIRGYRIELDEIEQALHAHKDTGHCVVIARTLHEDGENELIAYITGVASAEELKSYLKDILPHYMVPNYYVRLGNIPLTSNGKVDRKALPDPEGTGLPVLDYSPLVTDSQKQLGQIWSEVLRLNPTNIGLNSDFFVLGGDSIKAIQIVAKLRNLGYELKISDVMGRSKLEDMNSQLRPLKRKINQDSIHGFVCLNPIQKAFLENSFARGNPEAKAFYLQSFLLEFHELINVADIKKVIEKIISHHDVLRMRFYRNSDGVWEQFNNGNDGEFYILEEVALKKNEDKNLFFETQSIRLKRQLGFSKAPLVGVGLYHDTEKTQSYLLMSVHHLVIDLVSWRILFEDIEALFKQCQKGITLSLPEKTDSFKFWMERNRIFGNSHLLEQQREFWENNLKIPLTRFKVTNPQGLNTFHFLKKAAFVLSNDEMSLLYAGMNALNKVEINALLLSALARAINELFDINRTHIFMEGHGREEHIDDVDVSRTIGWFTSIYPFELNCENQDITSVFSLQDSLDKVPNKGVGYGLLHYLNDKPVNVAKDVQISFNYLGDFTRKNETGLNVDHELKLFNYSSFSHGVDFHPDLERETELEVIGKIQDGVLEMAIQYSSARMEDTIMQQLAENYKNQLLRISQELKNYNKKLRFPSSFTFKNLSFEQVEKITAEYGAIEDVYRLSPMQQGLYYHVLADPSSYAYFVQIGCQLSGNISVEKLENSFREIIARHGILRTVFRDDLAEVPLQLILADGIVDFRYINASEKGKKEQEEFIRQLREYDKEEGFNLTHGPLVRLIIIKLAENSYYQLWSNHHINLDGWSTNAVLHEFKLLYNSADNQESLKTKSHPKFSRYIIWLDGINREESKAYWRNYLSGYENKAALPSNSKLKGKNDVRNYDFTIDEATTQKLTELSMNERVTLNTLIQCAWGVLLSKYNNTNDVVFGSIVSGRPTQLEGIQEMVGVFINNIPQRISYTDQMTFRELLNKVQRSFVEGENHHYLNLAEIQNETLLKSDLFDHLLVFENYPISDSEIPGDIKVVKDSMDIFEQVSYDLTLVAIPDEKFFFRIKYNSPAFTENTIRCLESHWKILLESVVRDVSKPVIHYSILRDEEKSFFQDSSATNKVAYPSDQTIVSLFEKQVKNNPEAVALSYGGLNLTYKELNQKSNQLAHYLLKKHTVLPDDLVGIDLQRSEWMIIAMLAVIKAGGAYVPIDPDFPTERKSYIINNSGLKAVIDLQSLELFKEVNGELPYPVDNPVSRISPDNLLYVIFTSGSTGNPKGVLIEHKNVVRLLFNDGFQFDFNEKDVWTMFHNYNFDFSVWEMYGALLYGGKLLIVPKLTASDTLDFAELLMQEGVTVLNQTPLAFYNLSEVISAHSMKDKLALKYVIFGGEALQPSKLRWWQSQYPDTKLINMYGITETTVHVTYKEIAIDEINQGISNIGKPIPTLNCYVLDRNGTFCSQGQIGELYVGGLGVARGYLNQPILNKEKFVNNPFEKQGTLYKTGDFVRWLEDSSLEYIGRIDDQVKIRGHRIELGEIEHLAITLDGVHNAVALAKSVFSETKDIILYYSGDLEDEFVRKNLSQRLPDYMVPKFILKIDKFPINPNGKVDRSKLPLPIISVGSRLFKPESEAEILLFAVFKDVLKLPEDAIGEYTSFIGMGGDSIKSIQVISKLRAKGFSVKVADIMKMQSIKMLAKKLEVHNQPTLNKTTSDKFGLSPIQHFFFYDVLVSGGVDEKHFYNQSYLFDLNNKYTQSFIEDCLYDLICHHDSLRLKFEKEGDAYLAKYQQPSRAIFLLNEVIMPTGQTVSNREDFIRTESEKVKLSLNVFDGPLLGTLILQNQNTSSLLITCHHLVVDLVSWRIIIDDLNEIIQRKQNNTQVILPEKGSSYFQWVCALEKYAVSRKAQKQIDFWNDVLASPGDRIDLQMTEGRSFLSDSVGFELSETDTQKLLQSLSHCNQIEINSILLYAVSLAAGKVLNMKNVRFNLEGHGREEFDHDIHIHRTVGWFTSLFPFNVNVNELSDNPIQATVELNGRLNNLPDKGFGFSLLQQNKFLHQYGFPDYNSIEFNYMGSFYSNAGENHHPQALRISSLNHGSESSSNLKSGSILSVGSMIFDNRFSMKIWYNKKQLPENIMNAFSVEVSDVLQRLVMELLNSPDAIKTANGFNYKDISPSSLMRLEEDYGPIEDVLRLTPLQRGIYFHTELDNDPEMYFVQFGFLLKNVKNTALFKEVILEVLSAYDILKVVFTRELDQLPLQMVLSQSQAAIEELDISYLTAEEQKRYLYNYFIEQRKIPFNLISGNLIRIKLLKVGADDYYLLWNNHHIILDGWSTQILLNDIYRNYSDNLLSGSKRLFSNVDSKNNFRQYVDWLDNYNQDSAIEFWKKYLENYEPVLDPFSADNRHNLLFETKDAELLFDSELTKSVYSKAAQLGLTVSTLFQGLWAIIYSKYCISNDVVFGIVTSGRPSSLENVENIVGALINTVPLRIKLNDQESLQDYLRGIEDGYLQVEPHQYVGLSEIQNASGFKSPLISHAIVFENYPVPSEDNLMEPAYKIDPEWNHVFEKNSYNLSLIVLPEKTLRVILKYNANVISASTIQHIKKSLLNLMHVVVSDSLKKLNEIELLDIDAQLAIVDRCTDTTTELYNNSKTLLDQYYEGNLKPSNRAIIFRGKSYTYDWIENESNRFASFLKYFLGIEKGEMVAVQLPRSEYLQVVLLGILKNSCAYVPIALDQPASRTKFMLDDCGSKIVITTEILQIFIQDKIIHPKIEDLPLGNDLIYCLYTSGSTGQPKGCLLQHHSLLNRLKWMQNAYSLSSDDVILQKTPYTFDVSVWELFWWYMYGAQMCLLEQDEEKDPEAIIKAVEDNQVTVIHFVPSMFTVFLDYLETNLESTKRLQSLKQIFTSGEALLGYHLRRWKALLPETKLMNLYGPTEASIDVSYYDCSNWDGFVEEIPIGRPIFNTGLLILGAGNKILPYGSVGEIAISGVGLAKGYLNKPELTSQKFITHPTTSSEKVYLTGDLGRWNAKRELEYLGRLDDQVKIRGNRIELGEITSKVLEFEGVRESVVIAKKIELSSHLELVAYIVGTADFAKLKRYLTDNLPSYMVPSYYVFMESIPLSSSGKVNRKLLPDPENTGLDATEYVVPGTAMEIALAEVWASVLQKNIGKIGLDSDFFDLGGDSIKAIQVVSKLRVKGFSLRLADVISKTTLEQQARHIQKATREISQNPETGAFALGPIQYLFLNNGFMDGKPDDKSHFNQSYIFNVPEWADQEMLAKAWDKIILHHDALRLRFLYRDDTWIQEYAAPGTHNYQIHNFDLTANDEKNLPETIIQISESVKKATHLQNGPLVNLGFFICRDYNRLLVTIHHLAVDMVSWQIIKEDFGNLLLQLKENKSLELPLKTDSYKNWILAHHSADYKHIANKHRNFWEGLNMVGTKMLVPENTPKQPLSAWKDYKRLCSSVSQSQFIEISRKKKSSKADTLLLYALSKALNKTFGEGVYACYAETHGRIDNDVNLDVSRTVGWFTDMYPVLLNTGSKNENIDEFLSFHDRVYQQMELNKSFLWNHYLHSVSDPRPDSIDFVEFNFLGEISNKRKNQVEYVTESAFNSGADASQNLTPKARIIIVSGFVNGNLQFDVSASENCFSSHTINQLLNELETAAAEIINQLINSAQTLKSGVDFTYNQLTYNEIHSIEQTYGELEDVYRLSPMQKGLFYLGLYNENDQSYCVQFGEKYNGNLNVGFFKEAIFETIANNPSLKAIFRSDIGKDILQIIPKDADVDFEYIDLSNEKQIDHAAYCIRLAAEERSRPFDFSKGKLLRTKLFKWNDFTYYLIWTNHHIILDGWSTSIVLDEIRNRHNQKIANLPYHQESKPLFSEYIKWLNIQKEELSIEFWKNKLKGYNQIAEIKSKESNTSNVAAFYTIDLVFNLSAELSRILEQKAKSMKTTLNVIMQAAYGLILSCYSKKDDVVFGSIVSGRPPQIPDIQKMVGLLFNTIPVRVAFNDKSRLSELLVDIQKYFIESQDYHYLNLADFNNMGLAVRNPIRTLLTFENYPSELANDGYYDVSEEDKIIFEQTNYDLSTIIIPGDALQFIIKYNPIKYNKSQIDEIQSMWELILELIASDEDALIQDFKAKMISLIVEKEKSEIERQKNMNISKLKKFKK